MEIKGGSLDSLRYTQVAGKKEGTHVDLCKSCIQVLWPKKCGAGAPLQRAALSLSGSAAGRSLTSWPHTYHVSLDFCQAPETLSYLLSMLRRCLVQGSHDSKDLIREILLLPEACAGLHKQHSSQQVRPGREEGLALILHLCDPAHNLQ